MDVMAEQELTAVQPNGEQRAIRLVVGRPYPHPNGYWDCDVCAEGLDHWNEPKRVAGETSWQAMMLAIALLKHALASEQRRGAVLVYGSAQMEDEEEAVPAGEATPVLDMLFPEIGRL